MIPRIPTHAASFRIFRGYKRPDLDEDEFLSELGAVFMPGTPLMLRDLGLAAYLPAVVPRVDGIPGLPDEVAVIAYASRETYAEARNESIVGRMYTHTHRAVFDMESSRSQYPEPLGAFQSPATAFWCVGEPCDWQADGDVIMWMGYVTGEETDFSQRFIDDLATVGSTMRAAGVRECVGQVSHTWASLWLLLDSFGDGSVPAPVADLLRPGLGGSTELMFQPVARLLWRNEPPAAPVTRPSAWSYIFVRDARHFLGSSGPPEH